MNQHPNATVAGGTGSLGVLVAWLLGHFGVALSAEDGAVIATLLAAAALFVGRNGLVGVWNRILHGSPQPPSG